MKKGKITSVNLSGTHSMQKQQKERINLLKGLGVEGDAHMGKKIKHRSRVAKDPDQPNLRQVHLIQNELHDELSRKGFTVGPGQMGENITTSGIQLTTLPEDTVLKIGPTAQIQVKGLRSPCHQLNGVEEGLLKAVTVKHEGGSAILKWGIMGIVKEGGEIQPGDEIAVEFPEEPHVMLDKV